VTIHPVAIQDRISVVYVDRGVLERDGHALVIRQGLSDTIIPVGVCSAVLIGPGVSITHAAIALCAKERTLLLWVGEDGVRLYAAANPRSDATNLLRQSAAHIDERRRLLVARAVFHEMFGQPAPERRSIEQLRGIEGSRVRQIYTKEALRVGLAWNGRDVATMKRPIDAALAGVNAALYGLTEACILTLGFSPAIGFVHSGDPRSFVFDVADCVKFKTVVPLAFELAAKDLEGMERRSRVAARELFRKEQVASRLIAIIENLINAAGSN
jgi:CRISPR-associated protein Cas1